MRQLRNQVLAALGVEEKTSREHYAHAVENGINFFDTADMYSNGVSEQITGRHLREMGQA